MPSHPDRVRRNYPEGVPAFGMPVYPEICGNWTPATWADMWATFHANNRQNDLPERATDEFGFCLSRSCRLCHPQG